MYQVVKQTLSISGFALLTLILQSCSDPAEEPPPPAVQFPANIATIFEQKCVSCHTNDNVGTFSLVPEEDGYAEARANAPAIKETVLSGIMPPFLAKPNAQCSSSFHEEYPMSDSEIAAVVDWVDQGTPSASGPSSLTVPTLATLILDDIDDVTLTMKEAYTPNGSTTEDHELGRCFVIDGLPQIDGEPSSMLLTGFEVVPGNTALVHHVQLYVTSPRSGTVIETVTGWDNQVGAGYNCYGDVNLGDTSTDLIASWTPGTGAVNYPLDTGIEISKNQLFIMKVHYLTKLGTAPTPDITSIKLKLVPFGSVKTANIIAITQNNANGSEIKFPIDSGQVIKIQHKITQQGPLKVHAIMPHMHDLGVQIQLRHNSSCLLDVFSWNFEWQRFFFFDEQNTPVTIALDDDFSITCAYNTATVTGPVREGYDETEEHCSAYLYVSP